ncbi:4-hydroxy-3-methylbut-2-enyl diphosphate reductase [bacterium]|nr:4-hydroxy-3-methylbut-2-enyl diphosphate reductase [bacterium]
MNIHLAHTQGFCAGVASAIEVVNRALEKYGTPLYVRHHIVHNTAVIDDFKSKGVVFIETLSEVPEGARVIFSAHGVAPSIYEEAKKRQLIYVDATCPLVTKVHREATKFSAQGVQTILIGHRGHQELLGTSGYVTPELLHVVETDADIDALTLDTERPIGYLTQTTLSVTDTAKLVAKLKEKYPQIMGPPRSDICFATQNRQDAVSQLAQICQVMIICGSPHSSNSNRLKETAEAFGLKSYLIDSVSEYQRDWLSGIRQVGISSGASVPNNLVQELVNRIKADYPDAQVHQEESVEKDIRFAVPKV